MKLGAIFQSKTLFKRVLLLILLFFPIITSYTILPSDALKTNGNDIIEDIPWPTEEWPISTLPDQGMDPSIIEDLKEYIESKDLTVHSMLIVKNGYLVDEEYFGTELRRNVPYPIYSSTKSVISTLIGIAIDQGQITSVNQTMLEFFSNRTINNLDSRKRNITIAHLLSMTDGLSWDEWYSSYSEPRNSYFQMSGQTDWVQYVLDRPMVNEPGVSYNYNTGGSHLLSAILEVATGNQTEDYAKKFLFDPLNITNYYWKTDPTGLTRGGEGLYLIPRDMAKFGYLILHNGTWDNTQVVSSEWTRKATTKQTSTYTGNYDYGYQWWVRNQFYSLRYFMAHGFLGQRIYIVPEKNLVVIFTCDEPIFDIQTVLVENYIIPATNFSTVSSTSSSFSYFPFILGIAVISLFNKKKRLN